MKKFVIVALAALALVTAAGCGSTVATPTAPEPQAISSEPIIAEITAEAVADVMGIDMQVRFCNAREYLGDELGYLQFAKSYGDSDEPSAFELYEELASRC